MTNARKVLTIVLAAFVFIELAILFAAKDLNIWLSFGAPDSAWGLGMEVLGELVAPFIFVISGIVMSLYFNTQPDNEVKHKMLKVYTGLLFVVVGLGYSVLVLLRLEKWLAFVCILITGVLFYFVIRLLKNVDHGRLFQLYCIALTAIVYCVAVLIFINIFKMLWGRVRPRELISLEEFTPWYLPQGINGNRSFPSGHTANATILYIITMFAPIASKKLTKILLYVIPAVWILTMAISRVLVGAHYASDVLFGAAISIGIFYIVKRFTVRYIAKTI